MHYKLLGTVTRWVNRVVAALLAVILALVYWYAYRPLPQTSGTVKAPVEREIRVERDALGVPHIKAASVADALFAQGYVTAQERLFQMDGLRRLAAGELAEVVGAPGIEPDREARRLRLRRLAEAAYVSMAAGGPRGAGGLRARRELLHRHAPGPPAARVHRAGLPAAAVERGGFDSGGAAHVPHPDHVLEDGPAAAQPDGVGRSGQGAAAVQRAANCSRARMPGRSPGRGPPPASRCWPTICTWSGPSRGSGSWWTSRRRGCTRPA